MVIVYSFHLRQVLPTDNIKEKKFLTTIKWYTDRDKNNKIHNPLVIAWPFFSVKYQKMISQQTLMYWLHHEIPFENM